MNLFRNLFTAMNRDSVKYMVAGGIAVNLYGIERATADIDLVLLLDEKNISKFIKAAKKIGLKPRLPVKIEELNDPEKRQEWASKKGMMAFSLHDPKNPFFSVDVFITIPFDFDKVYRDRKCVKFENVMISILPLKELIKMKQKSDRPQDKADVFHLKKIIKDWKDE